MAPKIFRMDRTLPTYAGSVVDRKSGIFCPTLIYKGAGAVGQRCECHRRNCFHNIPKIFFLALELMNAPSMKCPEQSKAGYEARQTEPESLIVGRGNVQNDRGFRPVP